jgi:hypothetical protein
MNSIRASAMEDAKAVEHISEDALPKGGSTLTTENDKQPEPEGVSPLAHL